MSSVNKDEGMDKAGQWSDNSYGAFFQAELWQMKPIKIDSNINVQLEVIEKGYFSYICLQDIRCKRIPSYRRNYQQGRMVSKL